MAVFTSFIVIYILTSVSLYFLFPKADVDAWKGLVPGLNFIEWCKIVGRPSWWAALLLIPIVGIFIYAGLAVDMVRSFGKYKFWDSFLAVVLTPFSFFPLAFSKAEYEGPVLTQEADFFAQLAEAKEGGKTALVKKLERQNKYRKTWGREWTESIIFAVFAAAFIRMFLIEAYVIPTPSMEGSLLVGDFLFVSKAHYGIRTPQTIAMLPLLHNRVPIVGGESYFKKPSLPYFRLGALESIDNNDPIVFNWPVGDSVYVTKKRTYTVNQVNRNSGYALDDPELRGMMKRKDIITRPTDKKDHYIKRCIAKAGDTLHIRNKQVYINGKKAQNPSETQFLYRVQFSTPNINTKALEKHGITDADKAGGNYGYFLTDKQVEKMKEIDPNIVITPHPQSVEPVTLFPHDPTNFPKWSVDNYGPIWIPKAGETVTLTPQNIALYRRTLNVYEGNESYEEKGGQVFINGKAVTEYTFKQDYYWAMGDNRHNSEDSRAWGFVPHDHIVGKPLFIWFSTKDGSIGKGIRWNRLFSGANKF